MVLFIITKYFDGTIMIIFWLIDNLRVRFELFNLEDNGTFFHSWLALFNLS